MSKNDFADRVQPTGIQCDQCEAMVHGPTGTPQEIRTVTLHAEVLGWWCSFDTKQGKACHLCPTHRGDR